MKKLFVNLFLLLLSDHSFATAPNLDGRFDLSHYRQICGGRYFAACNSVHSLVGLNQWSVFSHAARWAAKQKKLVLVISGFDWCAPCVVDVINFGSIKNSGFPDVAKKVEESYVLVTVDREKWGARSVLSKVGISSQGFHEIAVYDPVSEQALSVIRDPTIEFSLGTVESCKHYENGIKVIGRDIHFDLRLEFLKNPRMDLSLEIAKRNHKARQECQKID